MWKYIIRIILRNRWTNLSILFLISLFFGYKAVNVKMSYEMAQMLPETDSVFIAYQNFKNRFGEDGVVMFIGIKDKKIDQLEYFNKWHDLTNNLDKIPGVKNTLSLSKSFILEKNDSLRKFQFNKLFKEKPTNQEELDSICSLIKTNPFYGGLLFNDQNATILAITLDDEYIGSNSRFGLMNNIIEEVEQFSAETKIAVHYSGLPYIRIMMSKIIKEELLLFISLTLLIASILLFLFFKSMKAVIFPMIIVGLSVVWSLGLLVILGFKITILTGILPPLVTIIAVENNIFLLNKYYQEYRNHGNKVKALARMIQTVGTPMLLTNVTTAVGFAAFIITNNHMLVEFGIITSLSILMVFILSLSLVPIFFSLLPKPHFKHLRYLDRKSLSALIDFVKHLVTNRRPVIYWTSLSILILGIFGMTLLKTTGNVVDDIPQGNRINTDLQFFEKEFNGVLPFEIQIDTRKEKGAMQMATLKRLSKLQDTLSTYSEFSKSLSVADMVKVAKFAYFNNDPTKYSLPNSNERAFILNYIPKEYSDQASMLNNFMDSTQQVTRVSVQMQNIASHEIDLLITDLRPKIDSIFKPDRYDVVLTGTSVVFLKGVEFLINNLFYSLLLAILVIAAIMTILFKSFKMASIAILPNLLPLIMTAALMGYLNINIKPSTIIIFSIALGISVDNTIHFLSRYRLALKASEWNRKYSVMYALEETVQSMIYSSIVLFLGFSVFMFSSFGGTQSLGQLISFTLLVAMLSNLVLLPSLLLTLDRWILQKQKDEPILDIFDEDEEIDMDSLDEESGK
ncbi:MAG: MMPL family transporter [Bacteroidales bacterium]|nr:MMPL family transporter [Bacteroidales bacterium]